VSASLLGENKLRMYPEDDAPAQELQRVTSSMYVKVQEFYDAMEFKRPAMPSRIPSMRRSELMTYIIAEVIEFGAAANLEDQVAEVIDILYFVMDVFVELGVDPDMPFAIVHAANMAKIWPDGKAHFNNSVVPPRMLKPCGWIAPERAICDHLAYLKCAGEDL